jgi:deferrochelatase/peroxidase EfeB
MQASALVGARWVKSSASNPTGNCVEIAQVEDGFAMRNSRFPDGPALVYTRAELAAFVEGVRRGDFDFVAG